MDLKPGQYQSALRLLSGAEDALQHTMSGVRKRQDNRTIGRRIEEVESLLKKAKRELRLE
jgi:ppGpp synthetase/RelA/SpoT-type nucleotidyltranferase